MLSLVENTLGFISSAGVVGAMFEIAACISSTGPFFPLSDKPQVLSACISVVFVNYQVTVSDAEAYTYDEEVIKKAEAMGKPGLVEINAKEDSFIFTVETTGAITAYELIMNAITVLKQKLDAVRLQDDDGDLGELGAHLGGP